jgi:hypothetical protein
MYDIFKYQISYFIQQVRSADAISTRGIYSRGKGEGGKCETVPFVNGSSDQLQTQKQDSQYHSASL